MLIPIGAIQLADRPFYTSASEDGRRFVACGESGRLCLFDNDLRQLDEMKLGTGVTWVQLNEDGSVMLIGFKDHIAAFTTPGNIAPLSNLAVGGTSGPCIFRNSEVICVASWRLTAWDLKSSALIDETPLPDRGGAGYWLVAHPEGEAMALIAFSGQSEEWLFWGHFSRGKLAVFAQPEIFDVSVPCFQPTGGEFVSHHERLGLCRMRFPSGQLISSIEPAQAFPENPDDTFSYDVHFFRDDRFLAWQACLGLYEFDLATLQRTATILTGADGMTFGEDCFFSEQSWQLAGCRLLTSDCRHGRNFRSRTDTLRLWDASAFSGPLSSPNPTRPFTQQLLDLPRWSA